MLCGIIGEYLASSLSVRTVKLTILFTRLLGIHGSPKMISVRSGMRVSVSIAIAFSIR